MFYFRKQTIQTEKKFDFLRDLVSSVPDHQAEDEGESTNHNETKKQKRSKANFYCQFIYNLKHRNKQ